jgi:hypothetical protein
VLFFLATEEKLENPPNKDSDHKSANVCEKKYQRPVFVNEFTIQFFGFYLHEAKKQSLSIFGFELQHHYYPVSGFNIFESGSKKSSVLDTLPDPKAPNPNAAFFKKNICKIVLDFFIQDFKYLNISSC